MKRPRYSDRMTDSQMTTPRSSSAEHTPKRRSQLSCQDGRLCVPPRVADRALAGIDRDAGCRSARTTGLVPALEEAFAIGGTERKPLGLVSRPTQTQPLSRVGEIGSRAELLAL